MWSFSSPSVLSVMISAHNVKTPECRDAIVVSFFIHYRQLDPSLSRLGFNLSPTHGGGNTPYLPNKHPPRDGLRGFWLTDGISLKERVSGQPSWFFPHGVKAQSQASRLAPEESDLYQVCFICQRDIDINSQFQHHCELETFLRNIDDNNEGLQHALYIHGIV